MTTLSRFEERLLAELIIVVAERAQTGATTTISATSAAAVQPRAARSRGRLVGLAAAGTAVAAAASALAVFGVPGGGATPAYAVERTEHGVAVTISDPTRLGGLSDALSAAGLRATVVPVSAGCTEPEAGDLPVPYQIRRDPFGGPDGALRSARTMEIVGPPVPEGKVAYLGFTVTRRSFQGEKYAVVVSAYAEISDQVRSCFPERARWRQVPGRPSFGSPAPSMSGR
jgi:hypothetical protein